MIEGVEVNCICPEWQKGSDQIFEAQIYYAQAAGIRYTGSKFKFCPWCGLKLVVIPTVNQGEKTNELR